MPQNFFEAFREANPHLFGEDSDFSDSDSENGEIEETPENFENEETDEVTDNEAIKLTLQFDQISNYVIPTWDSQEGGLQITFLNINRRFGPFLKTLTINL